MDNARDLSTRLAALLRDERRAMADFLVALSMFDERKLWRELGHASLFSYLRRELRLSAGAAQYRKTAAELIQAFPEVEAALRNGKLCLSSVIELAKVVTRENVADVLPRFFGLSSRDAAAVAVSIRPVEKPPVREVLVALVPAPARETAAPAEPDASGTLPLRAPEAGGEVTRVRAPEVPAQPVDPPPIARAERPSRPAVEPLDAAHARLHLTVSRRLIEKLQSAKDALSHARPGASTEEILEAGLDLILAQQAKRRGVVEKPRNVARPAKTGAVPAHVKRAAWLRAGGRCEYRLESGEPCGSTTRLELDHVIPRARGGPSTIDNVRITCRSHNDLAARQAFGDEWMDRFRRAARPARCDESRALREQCLGESGAGWRLRPPA